MEVQNEIRIAQSLLSQVDTIIKKHDEIAQIRGEKFNIFEILGLEWKETQLHSKMLAHLLDPKGSHGMGSRFLETFITDVLEMDLEDFECTGAMVEIEKSFYADGQELSRIDILIMPAVSTQQHIIIENKTTAVDQDRQLRRYHSYRPNGREPKLVYLTRFGEIPTEKTLGDLKPEGVLALSYHTSILNWIEKTCLPLTYDQYGLNHVLRQYVLSIRIITNQSTNNKMREELVDIITSSGRNISASFSISNAMTAAKKMLLKKFAKRLETEIRARNPRVIIEIDPEFGGKYNGIYFSFPSIESGYIQLSFLDEVNSMYIEIVNSNKWDDIRDGISKIEFYRNNINAVDWGKVENVEKAWNGDWVCRYTKLDEFFRKPENWSDIADGNDKYIVEKICSDMLEIIDIFEKQN